MGVSGSLANLNIAEVLLWLARAKKTGALVLTSAAGVSRVIFHQGKIVSTNREGVTPDQIDGALANRSERTILRLLSSTEGSFSFEPSPVPSATRIHTPLEVGALLLSGAAKLDELNRTGGLDDEPEAAPPSRPENPKSAAAPPAALPLPEPPSSTPPPGRAASPRGWITAAAVAVGAVLLATAVAMQPQLADANLTPAVEPSSTETVLPAQTQPIDSAPTELLQAFESEELPETPFEEVLPPLPESTSDLVEPGPGVTAPVLLHHPPPHYPEPMRKLGKSADIVVRLLVDETGEVIEIERAESTEGYGFVAEAQKVGRMSRWRPATKDGIPVKMWVQLRVTFRRAESASVSS